MLVDQIVVTIHIQGGFPQVSAILEVMDQRRVPRTMSGSDQLSAGSMGSMTAWLA